MSNVHELQLVNVIGHSAGAIIFGIFLYLLLRDRAVTRMRGSWLSVAAAGLAFLWNVGSLSALIISTTSAPGAGLVTFFSFSVLSLLPAVLLHLSLEGGLEPIIASGYGLGAIAVGMHFWELFHPEQRYHEHALLLITVGFAILTAE